MCICNHAQDGTIGRRLHPQLDLVAGLRRSLAVTEHEGAEAGQRLLPGHLLLDDRRRQRLHHAAGAGEAPVRVPPPGLLEHRVTGLEARRVVVGAEHRRHLFEGPRRTAPPGLADDVSGVRAGQDTQGRRPLRGADAAPDRAVGGGPVGRVGAAASHDAQRLGDGARPAGTPDPDL
jgi:hypothetical protein